MQTKRDRTPWVRRWYMPKANGPARPRGIPALEDNLGPRAGAKLVTAISEQDVLECRDGYRAGRGACEALRARTCDRQDGRSGSRGEAAIKGFVVHRDHPWLLAMWRRRIDDRALLPLMRPWRKAGMVDTAGPGVQPEPGTPQGGTVAPVLAKVDRP